MHMEKQKIVGVTVSLLIIALFVTGYISYFGPRQQSENLDIIDNEIMYMDKFILQSPAFKEGGFIGSKYTCDETNMSPPLVIANVPEGAKSLVLIMDDPDVPKALRPDGVFDHWVVYNIDPQTSFIDEGELFGTVGANGRGESKYTGPCPPPQYEPTTHRYIFKLFATDLNNLNFVKAPTKKDVVDAIQGHIIDEAILTGLYDRTKTIKENE